LQAIRSRFSRELIGLGRSFLFVSTICARWLIIAGLIPPQEYFKNDTLALIGYGKLSDSTYVDLEADTSIQVRKDMVRVSTFATTV
jgi:hypothetical protein